MKLIVGLGNPGRQYVGTRHNIGWEALERLAVRLGWIGATGDFDRQARSNFDALVLDGTVAMSSGVSEKVLLLKPLTFMNASGRALKAAAGFYQVGLPDMLVVLDDLALPTGRIRLRPGGSSGGHNGLKDIERALGSKEYPRLRIGIDAPPPRIPQVDYVLGRFSEEQRAALAVSLDHAVDAMCVWMEQGLEPAMNRFNG